MSAVVDRTIDVADLPIGTADSRALIWWGNLGMMVIEGTMFALLLATWIYLKTANLDWPPTTVPNPDLQSSTWSLAILILSFLPMLFADRGAMRGSVARLRIGFGICILAGLAFLGIRWAAMSTLGYKWSDHAYGSIVWMMLGLHTFHVLSATAETSLLLLYSFVRPMTKKQFLDARTTAVYWYFVIVMWIPYYFTIYVIPYYSRK